MHTLVGLFFKLRTNMKFKSGDKVFINENFGHDNIFITGTVVKAIVEDSTDNIRFYIVKLDYGTGERIFYTRELNLLKTPDHIFRDIIHDNQT